MKFRLESLWLSLFILALIRVTVSQDICTGKDCGKGTCFPDPSVLIFGYNCKCDTGWKQFQLPPLPITFPPCILPNCTLSQCGPPPPTPPPPNITDPNCGVVWCNYGTCVANGTTGHNCQCNQGYVNLLNLPDYPCYPQCAFGADCSGFGFGSQPNPPPPTKNGSPNSSSKCSRKYVSNLGLLSAIILAIVQPILG